MSFLNLFGVVCFSLFSRWHKMCLLWKNSLAIVSCICKDASLYLPKWYDYMTCLSDWHNDVRLEYRYRALLSALAEKVKWEGGKISITQLLSKYKTSIFLNFQFAYLTLWVSSLIAFCFYTINPLNTRFMSAPYLFWNHNADLKFLRP